MSRSPGDGGLHRAMWVLILWFCVFQLCVCLAATLTTVSVTNPTNASKYRHNAYTT